MQLERKTEEMGHRRAQAIRKYPSEYKRHNDRRGGGERYYRILSMDENVRPEMKATCLEKVEFRIYPTPRTEDQPVTGKTRAGTGKRKGEGTRRRSWAFGSLRDMKKRGKVSRMGQHVPGCGWREFARI